ncbi:MAG: hypothetical protein ACREUE_18135 [Panacagrimonas sp.]
MMKLAEVPRRLNEVSEQYQVPQRLRAAGETARRGASSAYHMALDHPKASATAGIILAAALVGGVLWYLFHDRRTTAERRPARVRTSHERRKRAKNARQAAA